MNPLDDVITAIATPIGEGGISVIRVSGEGAIEEVNRIFRGKLPLTSASTHTAHFGHIVDQRGVMVDEVIATVFREPHSYTAENCVEISCHGGMYVTRKVLETVLEVGARLAEPGEFTKRAFLNGRIDLAQAEAVADLIRSRSEVSRRVFLSQLEGKLSTNISVLRGKLVDLCSLMELELDFTEEGLEFVSRTRILVMLDASLAHLEELIKSYSAGRVYREGVKVVLAGRPNVGKSSILNALLNEERAIVTEVPGTTRDVIEENLVINGMLFVLKDTAGLRESTNRVEMEGISRTANEIKKSNIVILVLDATDPNLPGTDLDLVHSSQNSDGYERQVIVALNKVDMINPKDVKIASGLSYTEKCYVSAKTGYGLGDLKAGLVRLAVQIDGHDAERGVMLTSARQRNCISLARDCLMKARDDLVAAKSNEWIAAHLREALGSLGELIGVVTTEDILDNIFSKFCIGK